MEKEYFATEKSSDLTIMKYGKRYTFKFAKTIEELLIYFYRPERSDRIIEIETGDIFEEGDINQTSRMKLIREISLEEALESVNSGKHNNGFNNKGDNNKGNSNVGNNNNGYNNIGNNNNGYNNIGNNNKGNSNKGNKNIGSRNIGDGNKGNYNIGNNNMGNDNQGDNNQGDNNQGDENIGHYNKGNGIRFGCFCIKDNGQGSLDNILLFDKKSYMTMDEFETKYSEILGSMPNGFEFVKIENMSTKEKEENPDYKEYGGYLKRMSEIKLGSKRLYSWWKKINKKGVISKMPNFDKDIFEEITTVYPFNNYC